VRLSSGLSHPPVTFQPQPNLGGLGIMGEQPAQGYYQPNMVGVFSRCRRFGTESHARCDLACTPDIRLRGRSRRLDRAGPVPTRAPSPLTFRAHVLLVLASRPLDAVKSTIADSDSPELPATNHGPTIDLCILYQHPL
jgi:hypothetical protein